MSTKTIEFKFKVNNVLTDAANVMLRDASNTFGVRRTDTNGIIVAAGTALAHISTGIYRYTFTEPTQGLNYEYVVEWTYLGNTSRQRQVLQTGQAAAIAGSVAPGPSIYVEMGIRTVACGDSDLESFLSVHAATVWAMQARRGVVLDLRFQLYVLDLITLALDHVRMLIDTESQNQQMQGTGYNNASNSANSDSVSTRNRTASSTQSGSSSQSFTRTASRTSSSQMGASGSQTSSRTGSGTDVSTQTQTSKTTHTTSQHMETITTPYAGLATDASDFKVSDTVVVNNSEIEEWVKRRSDNLLLIGNFSGQEGVLPGGTGTTGLAKQTVNHGVGNTSTITSTSRDQGGSHTITRTVVSGKGKNSAGTLTGGGGGSVTTDLTTIGTGSRTNAVHRSSSSTMTGSSVTTSSSQMESTSHEEQHRAAENTFHSESLGHSESTASSLAHSESLGAQSMVSSGESSMVYYHQIFESLKVLWEQTKQQIQQLEKQVMMESRYVAQKLGVRSAQATLVKNVAARTPIRQSPLGGLIDTQLNPYRTR